MNPIGKETRAAMISEIIDELSESQKITYLTLYFNGYTWEGLKGLLGLITDNYDKIGMVDVSELINNKSDKSIEEMLKE